MKLKSRRQKAEGSHQRAVVRWPSRASSLSLSGTRGFSLIELVITVAVLAILTLGVVPLVQVSVKRQKEQQLHEALREMREAIDQFHREAVAGAQMQANQQQGQTTAQQEQAPRPPTQNPQQAAQQGGGGNIFNDPRVRVGITDQTIFTADNPDRFPPDLDTLVKGVNVLPITAAGGLGRRGNMNVTALEAASDDSQQPRTKIYLRRIPVDPMTGKADWEFRSCYDTADTNSWGGENVFDVRSKSDAVALNGEKYRDW
ncbi:MAG TPA: prepilin-type N-terminal cleavage/methylation domain-containing protein [Pyrinomonadaceae bacterium]|jgi:general secretion pathway protein G|nr:prepilin-type N-terminal cleavage/methylation domain-containing protein [Pyrinomonadaceae bacterium]